MKTLRFQKELTYKVLASSANKQITFKRRSKVTTSKMILMCTCLRSRFLVLKLLFANNDIKMLANKIIKFKIEL